MKLKKVIIIGAMVSIAIGITAVIIFLPKTGTVKIETPSGYEMFYLKNPELKLESLPDNISHIDSGRMPGDFIGILGFSEYPLIFRDAWTGMLGGVTSNSDGTAFLAECYLNDEKVLYYGNKGKVKKIYEPDIISAVLISDGDEIAWISGDEYSANCTVKKLKNGKITTLTNNASYYIESGYPSVVLRGTLTGDILIWNEGINEFTGSYTTYLYKDGKTAPLGKDIEIRAIAAGGERIFYEQGSALFVQNGFDTKNRVFITDYSCITEDTKTEASSMGLNGMSSEDYNYVTLSQPDMSNIYIYAFNRDYSQAIVNVSLYGDQRNFYYEEGKTPLLLTDKELGIVSPDGGTRAENLSEYYFTTENDDRSYNVYRFDGELKPFFDFPVLDFRTFSDTDNILYKTEENLWIYDSKTGKSTSVYEHEKSSFVFYKPAPDLSMIYVSEREEDSYSRPLYAVKPDGTKIKIADDIKDYYLDGEKLYYMSPGYSLYVYENGKSEKLISFGEYYDNVIYSAYISGSSGYLIIDVSITPEENEEYGSGHFISTDGRSFVNIYDYLK